jgi:septal ring factor EnvC (AmiA/AmiB activator)
MWNGDSGFYRIPKGPRIAADSVECAVVERVIARFSSDELAQEISDHYRELSEPAKDAGREAAALRRKIADIEKRISRLTALLSETTAPEALLRQIEALEAEREAVIGSLNGLTDDAKMARAMRIISVEDVKRMLAGIAEDLNAARPELLRDTLRQVIKGVTLDPLTFDAAITYRIDPAVKAGSSWRPHGDSNPGSYRERVLS